MKLIIVRHNQRQTEFSADEFESIRVRDPKHPHAGIVTLKSGRELLCSDLPYVRAQLDAIHSSVEVSGSLFDMIFGKNR